MTVGIDRMPTTDSPRSIVVGHLRITDGGFKAESPANVVMVGAERSGDFTAAVLVGAGVAYQCGNHRSACSTKLGASAIGTHHRQTRTP